MTAKVYHADLWGTRERKYAWLEGHALSSTEWTPLAPAPGFYLFVPRDERLAEVYERHPKVTDVFPLNGVGMTTARDGFVIDFDRNRLLNRIRLFRNSKENDDELHSLFQINRKLGWDIRKSWNMLQSISESELGELIAPVLYRPFDVRWIFYHDAVVWRTVRRIMRHMMQGDNIALVTPKQFKEESGAFVSDSIIGHKTVSAFDINYLFPLYLYPSTEKKGLFHAEGGAREPNVSPAILASLAKAYGSAPSPEDVFYYVYAVLYSETYRTKYAEFLRMDFPRVPFAKDPALFKEMAGHGERLAVLHLLRSGELDTPIARFQGKGDNGVEKVRVSLRGRAEAISRDEMLRADPNDALSVHINADQYFEGVSPEVWRYQIGGYQVMDKWLKDRKGRALTLDEIRAYCRIATAIHLTVGIQKDLDALYGLMDEEIALVEGGG